MKDNYFRYIPIGVYLSLVFSSLYLSCVFLLIYSVWLINTKDESDHFKSFIFISGIFIAIAFALISFSLEEISDFKVYKILISDVLNDGVDYNVRGGEFGYFIIVSLLGVIMNDNSEYVHISLLVISNVILFLSLYRLNYKLSIFVFFIIQSYFALWINPYLSRQFLSFTILILTLSIDRKYIKYILYVFATFIHFSSIIFLLFILIPSHVMRKRFLLIVLLVSSFILSLIFSLDVLKQIESYNLVPSFILPKINFYFRMYSDGDLGVDFISLFFMSYILYCKFGFKIGSNNLRNEKLVNIFFLSALLQIITMNIPILPTRISFFSYYFSMLLIIIINGRDLRFTINGLAHCIFIVLFLFLSIYKIYINDYLEPWMLISNGNIFGAGLYDFL